MSKHMSLAAAMGVKVFQMCKISKKCGQGKAASVHVFGEWDWMLGVSVTEDKLDFELGDWKKSHVGRRGYEGSPMLFTYLLHLDPTHLISFPLTF